ncbi:hypothetical protein PGIGA_G00135610 [Pangasianodon gigas]|uniref:Uncharacterized protein n=1 Tax=Pangasianodon gigas TaxID=30993 RepID=A0ACC5XKS9_PANGG|nr:hypothetical protein [Pangasianodon gigas]
MVKMSWTDCRVSKLGQQLAWHMAHMTCCPKGGHIWYWVTTTAWSGKLSYDMYYMTPAVRLNEALKRAD